MRITKTGLKGIVVGIIAACGLFISGCGYTTRSAVLAYRTIYIEPFINKINITKETDVASRYRTYRPAMESDITKAVKDRFLFDGNMRPANKEDADVFLKGELAEFRRDILRYTSNDEAEEYRLNIVVNISLWDNQSNTVIWEENSFTGDTTYFTRGPAAKAEDAAITDALKDLARRVVERTVEQW